MVIDFKNLHKLELDISYMLDFGLVILESRYDTHVVGRCPDFIVNLDEFWSFALNDRVVTCDCAIRGFERLSPVSDSFVWPPRTKLKRFTHCVGFGIVKLLDHILHLIVE